ncbi:hypothetical protein KIMH_05510 [Bombiscardovia apis]|uniref:Fluoride-specific ion channel FluC n=1 Tax=Bombiscardovia apis TaxID=2932182 RepID=A0ABM8BC16_9BIFI|nr:CrcB family protein [Bombiscardovia apis]BDR54440.1 hypothetical protein KIMH_05510 [Bombiscardovia apis]
MLNPSHPDSDSPSFDFPLLIVVIAGGALGTGLRYLLTALPNFSWYFYTGTFIANILACSALGLLTGYLSIAAWIPQRRREYMGRGLGMGLCGGLSTLSALMVEVITTARDERLWSALIYLVGSFAACIFLAWFGTRCGRRLAKLRGGRQ